MKTAPLQAVKTKFGDKAKLVAAVTELATADLWLGRVNDVKGLASVSNAKLLKLHDALTRVKKDFGSRAKLIDAILALGARVKDAGLRSKFETYPTPRLLDLLGSEQRRSKAEAKKPKAPKAAPKKKKARSKKAKAKAKTGAPAPAKTKKK
jgi:hypothetical protein